MSPTSRPQTYQGQSGHPPQVQDQFNLHHQCLAPKMPETSEQELKWIKKICTLVNLNFLEEINFEKDAPQPEPLSRNPSLRCVKCQNFFLPFPKNHLHPLLLPLNEPGANSLGSRRYCLLLPFASGRSRQYLLLSDEIFEFWVILAQMKEKISSVKGCLLPSQLITSSCSFQFFQIFVF